MPLMFSADDLATMLRLRSAFDPDGLCNPGKVLPDAEAVRRGARAVPAPSGRARGGRAVVIEHEPGDLTCTVGADVSLAELQATLARGGQMLALDPPAGAGLTVSEAFATAAFGPRAHRYGGPRDLVLGVTVRLADGTVARGGGRVVKTVAGYDLPKLFTAPAAAWARSSRIALASSARPLRLPATAGRRAPADAGCRRRRGTRSRPRARARGDSSLMPAQHLGQSVRGTTPSCT